MADHPQAMADLRALLAAREPLYAQADYIIDTAQVMVDAVVESIARELPKRGRDAS
jgi:shikimate kinase